MIDDLIPECKPTPHPDAVASGTCPAPSPEPVSPSDAPTEPTSTTYVPTPVEEPSLPVTGPGTSLMFVVGLAALTVAAILITITRRRNRKTW